MIIIYYTDTDGKIVQCTKAPNQVTQEDLFVEVKKFNDRNGSRRTAHIFDAPDDGLTAYLFREAMERRRWDREDLQEAITAIEVALDSVRGLES